MPLIQGQSQKSFGENVKMEMNSGKPQKQALAIAYAVKRRMAKKMAQGGIVKPESVVLKEMDYSKKAEEHESIAEPAEPKKHVVPHMAHGGMMHDPKTIAKMIMAKKMSQGGSLEDEALPESDADDFLTDDMAEVDMGHETYPENGTEHMSGMEEEDDEGPVMKRKSMIGKIMSGLHSKHYGK